MAKCIELVEFKILALSIHACKKYNISYQCIGASIKPNWNYRTNIISIGINESKRKRQERSIQFMLGLNFGLEIAAGQLQAKMHIYIHIKQRKNSRCAPMIYNNNIKYIQKKKKRKKKRIRKWNNNIFFVHCEWSTFIDVTLQILNSMAFSFSYSLSSHTFSLISRTHSVIRFLWLHFDSIAKFLRFFSLFPILL